MSKVANRKVGLLIAFFILHFFAITKDNAPRNEKDIHIFLTAVEPVAKLSEPIKIKLKFFSTKGVYRIYRHEMIGVSAAVGFLTYKLLFPGGKVLSKAFIDYDLHIGGVKYPYKGDYIDISPDISHSEIVAIYPAEDDNQVWPCEGEVKIQARYYYEHNNIWKYGSDLWEGEIESNWVTVKVIK